MIITNRISLTKLLRNTRGNLPFLLFTTALTASLSTQVDMTIFEDLSLPAGFFGDSAGLSCRLSQ